MLLRARVVFPVGSPPIENGAVRIGEGRILEVGRSDTIRPAAGASCIDLGETILLPGLINAHCHLDLTRLARHIPPPSSFTDWVKQLISLKAGWSYTDFAQSWLTGMHQLIESGTTTVGDIVTVPELLPDVLPVLPLRITTFREIISIRNRGQPDALVESAARDLEGVNAPLRRAGLSPHAPYSTYQDLVTKAAADCRSRGWRWSMHLAESIEEQSMFRECTGPLFHWLKSQRDMSDCGRVSPFEWLEATQALSPELLLAHVNLVNEAEISRLAASGAQVVHCPRSHDYFQHPPFPYHELVQAGVRICLGTDSLVSVRSSRGQLPTLSLFAEMAAFAHAHPEVKPHRIVEHATRDGALGLGWHDTGLLAPPLSADLITIPWSGSTRQAAEAIVHHEGPVISSMVEGRWVQGPLL